MTDPKTQTNPDDRHRPEAVDENRTQDDVTSGKGRRDEVGPTGIYPSTSDAPADAEVRTPGELGHVTPGKEALTVVDKPSDSDDE